MTADGVFAALTLAAQCDGPGALPCPEAMIMWYGQEACFCVDPQAYLARCERDWEQDRYYPAAGYAALFCTHNKLPLPDWLADVVNHAMLIAFEHGGMSNNNRRAGRYKAQAGRLEVHRQRWSIASAFKSQGVTDDEAFERTSEDLRGTAAQGQPRQVEESYRKIQRRLKAVQLNRTNKGTRSVR